MNTPRTRRGTTVSTGGLVVLALCTATCLAPPAQAADPNLYVNKASASCTDSGAGSQDQPFCTLTKAAAVAKAGNTVLVSAGTYVEQLTPKNTGTVSAPLTFQAQPGQAVTITGGPYGIYISTKSYVIVRGFAVTQTPSTGIYVKGSDHVTVDANHVSRAGQRVDGSTARGIVTNSTIDSVISGNLVEDNSDSGIYVGSGSTRVTLIHNETTANARGYTRAAPGIDIRSVGNSVLYNTSYRNEDSGVQIRTGGDNSLVVGNLVYLNGDHGIDVLQAPGCRIIGNTSYRNLTAGINDEGSSPGSTGATIMNNISVDNGINSPRTDGQIRVDKDSTAGTVMDSNLVWMSVPGYNMLQWGTVKYKSIAAFQSATGQEPHGLQLDPLLLNPAQGDMRLGAGSPAIDSADSGASGEALLDYFGAPRFDDPAVIDTGRGPRSYDDRGAVESQP